MGDKSDCLVGIQMQLLYGDGDPFEVKVFHEFANVFLVANSQLQHVRNQEIQEVLHSADLDLIYADWLTQDFPDTVSIAIQKYGQVLSRVVQSQHGLDRDSLGKAIHKLSQAQKRPKAAGFFEEIARWSQLKIQQPFSETRLDPFPDFLALVHLGLAVGVFAIEFEYGNQLDSLADSNLDADFSFEPEH